MGPLDGFKRWVFGQAHRKMDPLLKDGRRNIREIYTATSASTKGISSDVTYLGSDFSFSPMKKKKKSACVYILRRAHWIQTTAEPEPPPPPPLFQQPPVSFYLFFFGISKFLICLFVFRSHLPDRRGPITLLPDSLDTVFCLE